MPRQPSRHSHARRGAASAAAPPRRHRHQHRRHRHQHRRHRHRRHARRGAPPLAHAGGRAPAAGPKAKEPGRPRCLAKQTESRAPVPDAPARPARAGGDAQGAPHSRPTCRRPQRGAGRPRPAWGQGAAGPDSRSLTLPNGLSGVNGTTLTHSRTSNDLRPCRCRLHTRSNRRQDDLNAHLLHMPIIYISRFILAGRMHAIEAKDWWRASQADLKAMEVCYNSHLYGISAYHCQQALEKAAKSAVVYHNLPIDVKKLGHNILYKMFDKLATKTAVTEARKEYNNMIVKLLESVGRNVQLNSDNNMASTDVPTKDFFWGYSIGIKVHNGDIEKFLNGAQEPMLSAVNERMPRLLDVITASNQRMGPDDFNKLIEYARDTLPQQLKIGKPDLRIWYWIFLHLITILKITPHEEYGRYPGIMYGKKREEWYTMQHEDLKKLEDDVVQAVDFIRKNVLTRC